MRKILILLAAVLTLTLPARAAPAEGDYGAGAVDSAVPDSAEEILGGWERTEDAQSALGRIAEYAAAHFHELLSELLKPFITIVVISMLCTAASGVLPMKNGLDYVNLGGCLATAAVAVGDMSGVLGLGRSTMAELSDFTHVLLPAVCASAAAAGAVSSAPVKYAASAMFLDVLSAAAEKLVFPLICAYTAAVIADAAIGGGRLGGAVKLLRRLCRFMLTAIVTSFTLYLGLTGIIASSTDAVLTRAAKTALSTALPVVGGIISDAAGSIVAGAGALRTSLGVMGLIVTLAVCLVPFMKLGLRYLLFKAAASLAQSGEGRLPQLLDGTADACAMVLGAVGAQAVFVYISVIAMLKAVGG